MKRKSPRRSLEKSRRKETSDWLTDGTTSTDWLRTVNCEVKAFLIAS